jgi:hypothetical protein
VAPAPERAQWAEVAADDWQAFLLSRAAEFMPGGQLVIQSGGVGADGLTGGEPIFIVAKAALDALVTEGRLRGSEARRIFFPAYYRSREEYLRPLSFPPVDRLWKLEAETWLTLPDTFLPALEAGGSAAAFASAWTGWLRGFSEAVFFTDTLDSDRDTAYRQAVADEYYEAVHDRIEAAPHAACTD